MLSSVFALVFVATAPASAVAAPSAAPTLHFELPPSLRFRPFIGPDASLCLGGLCGAQLGVAGRLELGRLVPALSSSFAQWSVTVRGDPRPSLGLALADVVSDKGLLVSRVGYGLYLGRPKMPRSQLFVYYDRELRLNGVGKPNSLFRDPRRGMGVDGTLFLTPQLGLQASVRLGERWFTGLTLVYWH